MVKAILDGRKTVTRRIIKIDIVNQFDIESDGKSVCAFVEQATGDFYEPTEVAQYQVGDILWVRETFCTNYFDEYIARLRSGNRNAYKADYNKDIIGDVVPEPKWHPSIYMPKECARIFLKVTDVRVERLQDITEEQARAEGFTDKEHFITTFLKLYTECSLETWIFVYGFERCEKPEGWC